MSWSVVRVIVLGMIRCAALSFLAACAAANGASWVAEHGGELRFGNGRLEARFDHRTGRWLALYEVASSQPVLSDGGRLASVVLTTDGTTTATGQGSLRTVLDTRTIGTDLTLSGWREETQGAVTWLVLDTMEGNWKIEQRYGLERRGDTLRRSVRLTWSGNRETLLRMVELRTPALTGLGNAILEAPGYPGVLHQPLDQIPRGRWRGTGGTQADRPNLLLVRRGDANLLIWGYDHVVPSSIYAQRGDWGIWLAQELLAATRVRQGQSVEAGTQYISLRVGSLRDALLSFRRFWNEVSAGRRGRTPAWARDALIYEVRPGPKPFPDGVTYESHSDVAALTEDLPRIAGLGFNAVQLMPRHQWPGYRVVDYANIEAHYGPEPDVRRLVARAHALGMKVILDVVMHGVIAAKVPPHAPWDRHPWLAEHPDWFSYTEDGEVARTFIGITTPLTWSFDQASPSFQDYIVRVFCDYVRKLGVDGFRVDAITWNSFPNWARGLDRPGYASFFASKPLFDRVRDAVHQLQPETVFYTETTGPVFNTCFDLTYNYDEHWLYRLLLPLRSARGYATWPPAVSRRMNARQMGEWLELRRLALPPDVLRVHHADSHDSHQFGDLHMFKKEAFGVDGARLLFALSAFLDGAVMNFAGAENGSEDFYRRVLALRRSTPALSSGSTCDYLAVESSSDRVFAPLRSSGRVWALPVLSFSEKPVSTRLSLTALRLDAEADYTFTEAFGGMTRRGKGKNMRQLEVTLPPYGVQLWRVELTAASRR